MEMNAVRKFYVKSIRTFVIMWICRYMDETICIDFENVQGPSHWKCLDRTLFQILPSKARIHIVSQIYNFLHNYR